MKKEKDIWTLSANYLSGEMTAEEREKFNQYLGRNPSLRIEFDKINLTWNNLKPNYQPESNKSWENLHHRLKNDGLLGTREKNTISFNYYLMRVVAAVVVVGLIVGISMRYFSSGGNSTFLHSTTLSANENVKSYSLPDGSSVFLNKGSRLTYSENFGENRRVKLKGEGFFEVVSDPENPFLIETRNAFISVLGTKFNVKENQNITEVLVESGTVQLKKDLNSTGLIISKGDFATSDGKTESLKLNSNINYLSWKTHDFKFSDVPLREAINVLEESYHIKINIQDDSINEMKLSSTYSQQSIDAIMQTICIAFDLSCKQNEKEYSLMKNK